MLFPGGILGVDMAPEGWADWTWWRMIQGAQTFILDGFSADERANTTVHVRAIDVVTISRNKALVFDMKVGDGHIIAVGLNVLQRCVRTPSGDAVCPYAEQAWVLDRMLRHAGDLLAH